MTIGHVLTNSDFLQIKTGERGVVQSKISSINILSFFTALASTRVSFDQLANFYTLLTSILWNFEPALKSWRPLKSNCQNLRIAKNYSVTFWSRFWHWQCYNTILWVSASYQSIKTPSHTQNLDFRDWFSAQMINKVQKTRSLQQKMSPG